MSLLLTAGLTIGRWLLSAGLGSIEKRIAAVEERKRIALENGHEWKVKLLDAELGRLHSMLEAQGRPEPWTRKLFRALLVTPAIVLLWKIVVWDKVLGWGVTDPLGELLVYYVGAVISYYLGAFAYDFYRRRQ